MIDVAIVGGGPAGLACALALAKRHSVALIDRDTWPRWRPGETTPPNIVGVLNQLGLDSKHFLNEHLQAEGTASAWGSPLPGYNDFFLGGGGHGYRLNRESFDAWLMRTAQERGVAVYEQASLSEVIATEKGWKLTLAGFEKPLNARFVVDAGGRSAPLASKIGMQRVKMDQLVAVMGRLNIDDQVLSAKYTMIEACPDGWWYASRVPGDMAMVAWMTDGDLLQSMGQKQVWQKALAESRCLSALGKCEFVEKPRVLPAWSQFLGEASGDGWLAVGDAASAYDPLSSAGIVKGMLRGIAAARVICFWFEGDHRPLSIYAREERNSFEAYLGERRLMYCMETRWSDKPFWQRRHGRVWLDPKKRVALGDHGRYHHLTLPEKELKALADFCNEAKPAHHLMGFLVETFHLEAHRALDVLQDCLEKKFLVYIDDES